MNCQAGDNCFSMMHSGTQMDMSGLSDEGLQMEHQHMSGILDGFPTTMSMDEELLASTPVSTGTLPGGFDC